MSKTGMKTTALYAANGVMMAISFLLLRVMLMGWLGFRAFYQFRVQFFDLPTFTVVVMLSCFVFGWGLQLFWTQKVFAGLVAHLAGRSRGGGGSSEEKQKSA